MQRLLYICSGTSRFFRVVGVNHLKNSKLLYEKQNTFYNTNNLIFTRCLTTKNDDSRNTKGIDTHADLYKPSTAKQETHVPDDLRGGQPPETIETIGKSPLKSGGKVWSAQDPDGIHLAPLNRTQSTTFVSKSTEGSEKAHETTVYSTQGKLNIADPFKTHKLQPEGTPAQLAEAAAASAFEPFAPDTPLTPSPSTAEAVFAPKVSSTELHSTISSPTAHFDTAVPSSSQQDTVKYKTAHKAKVFGGQDTSAESKKRPKENPFNLKEQIKPKQRK